MHEHLTAYIAATELGVGGRTFMKNWISPTGDGRKKHDLSCAMAGYPCGR
jgi:hypothetical protein